jgi:hypothetical protein
MSVEFDAKLTDLAAGIWRDAVRGFDPVVIKGYQAMLGGFDATGSFSAVTGSFAAVTGALPALTGSFAVTGALPALTGSFAAAVTGSFAAVGANAAQEPSVTLKRVFWLPGKLPGVRLPPEPELAAMARSAPLMTELVALSTWLGPDGRLVTGTEELADDDAVDACGRLGIGPGQLSFLWKYALISGWLVLADSADRRRTWAMIGPTAHRWAAGDDSGVLHGWAAVFAAVAARALGIMAESERPAARARELDLKGPGVALVVMLFAARQAGMSRSDIEDLVKDGAVGEHPSFFRKRAWNAWVQEHGHPAHRLLGELASIGAVAEPPSLTGGVELTPLALWAMRRQFLLDKISVPALREPSPRLPAAALIDISDAVSDAEFDVAFAEWMHGRDPEQAARELLIYAGSADSHGRLTAVRIARRIGTPGYRAWKDAVNRPELRGYARISLSMMASDLPNVTLPAVLEPDPDDMAWLATDLLAATCSTADPDPDELARRFAEAVPDGQRHRVLGLMAQLSHPDAARVLDVLGIFHPNGRVARDARKALREMARNQAAARTGRHAAAR